MGAVTTDLELCTVFRDAEAIVLPTNADGSAKGYAYVEFKDAKLCKDSLDKYRGANISGNNIFVDLFDNILTMFLEEEERKRQEKLEKKRKEREAELEKQRKEEEE